MPPGPEVLSPAVAGVVSASRRMRPERPTRGSSVSSWPGPVQPAARGRRLHRWTSPEYLTALVGEPVFPRCGRRGPVLSPGLRPAVRRPVVRTAVSTSGPPAKASCPRPSLGGRDCGLYMGGFQVGSGIPEALNHILEGRISLNSCRSGAGPFLIPATRPVASSARLAPAMRLCSPYCPSSSGVS